MIDAFLLAWFTHLTTKILADLQYHLFGPDAMMKLFEMTKSTDVVNKAEIEENKFNVGNRNRKGNGKSTPEKSEKTKKKDH